MLEWRPCDGKKELVLEWRPCAGVEALCQSKGILGEGRGKAEGRSRGLMLERVFEAKGMCLSE